ncbi:MAG: glycosyltransferase family 4 protein [Chlorogloeopsis fritschii C42_A2020_084]|uniref:glycosyltransferase family 4 protein n=1 Tax=Chlorogloeopsis fritschii TaxID=1124 RepID=UPI0019EF403B|nr:glycosyltransferase family 1 protein [Chlorogloeopsis fritschii]MBF2005336.1 glycosyltransferase family 4 protein [Chlorogloeopsis fritschii C42_A2020_084]
MNEVLINLSIIFSQPTGISNYAKNLFPYFKSLQPTLLTAQNYPDFNCYSIPGNLTPAQGTKGHFDRILWTQFQLPEIYKKLQSKLIFSPVPEAPLYSNCRFVVMVHDLIALRFPKRFSPLTTYQRYYIPQVLRQAQHIICNSQATARDIIDFYKIPAQKITPILLAYDDSHFRPFVEEERESGRGGEGERDSRRLVVSTLMQRPYFLYIGRHDPYKNLHKLISAFAALPSHRDRQLWLAGPKDKRYTPLLQVQVEELGITEQVKFLNYVPDRELPKIISGAIALVFPSLWEGFGLPVLEAMACGTPVITSNLSSLPEVAGDAAILINPYKVEEITEAMDKIATDAQLRDRLSAAAISRASNFSWEKTGMATVEVLKQYL